MKTIPEENDKYFYFKNMHETTMFIENRKKADGEKLS
jgi:hypothetical protein